MQGDENMYFTYLKRRGLFTRTHVSVVGKKSFGMDTVHAQVRQLKNTRWVVLSCGNRSDQQQTKYNHNNGENKLCNNCFLVAFGVQKPLHEHCSVLIPLQSKPSFKL